MVDIYSTMTLALAMTCGYLSYTKKGTLFCLGVIFNSYSILYFVLGILIFKYDIKNGYESTNLVIISQLCVIAVLGFNSIYLIGTNQSTSNLHQHSYTPSFQIVCATFLTGVLATWVVIYKVGFLAYFFIDRLDRFPIMKENQQLLYIGKFTAISLILSMYRFYVFRQNRDKILATLIASYCLFLAILTISRSELAFLFITVFYFLNKMGITNTKKLLIYGSIMAVLMLFYKGLLYIYILGSLDTAAYNPGEFVNWIRNSLLLMEGRYDSSDLPNNSYLLAIKSIFFVNPGGDALSEWFIQQFYPDKVVLGLTYGFSGIIEGFLYFKHAGVFLHFFCIGAIFRWIDSKKGAIGTILSISAMYIMFRLFRSEIYNFSRTFTWYFIYQTLAVFIVDSGLKVITKSLIKPRKKLTPNRRTQ